MPFPASLFGKLELSPHERSKVESFHCRTAVELLSIVRSLRSTFEMWLGSSRSEQLMVVLEELVGSDDAQFLAD